MLIDFIIMLGYLVVNLIFGMLDVLPSAPDGVINVVDKIFDMITAGATLFTLFVDIKMVKILIPIVLAIINFDNLYHLIMYVIKKIPFIDIK